MREWHANTKDAEARRKEILRVASEKGTDGVAVLLLGESARPPANRNIVAGAVSLFLHTKAGAGRSARTVSDLKSKLRPLLENHAALEVHTIQPHDLQRIINALNGGAQNKLNHFRAWRSFFNWCVRTRILRESPTPGVEVPAVKRKLPAFADPWRVSRLVLAALHDSAPAHGFRSSLPGLMLPHVLLTFFSGVRPEEATRLSWKIVNFDRGEIILDEKITKISRVRPVRLAPELAQILQILKSRDHELGRFSRRVFERIRRRAGIEWAIDIGRHTYASYSFALRVPEAELVADMGNSVSVLRSHYVNRLASVDAATRWRAILPQLLKKLKAVPVE